MKHMSVVHADGSACACQWICLGVEDSKEHGMTDTEMGNLFTAFAMLRTGAQLVRTHGDRVTGSVCGGGKVFGGAR